MLDRGVSMSLVQQEVDRFFDVAPRLVHVPKRRFLLTHIRRQRLLQNCETSNAALARNFLGGVPAFDMVPEHDDPSEIPLGAEAAGILAAYHVDGQSHLRRHSQILRGLSRLKRSVTGLRIRS